MVETHPNLLATGPRTTLPDDPALAELTQRGMGDFLAVLRRHPQSSLCWALLAEASLLAGTPEDDVAGYAYARTGYHRGLDALRRSGWRGEGPVPWQHVPNQGFLRCLWALSVAAGRLGEADEQERCAQFLRDSSETAYQVLSHTLSAPEQHPQDEPRESEEQSAADLATGHQDPEPQDVQQQEPERRDHQQGHQHPNGDDQSSNT